MKIATTTGDFGKYLTTNAERIRELHLAGFRYIDLSMYSIPETNRTFGGENFREETERLKKLAEELGMKFVQAHSPGGNPLDKGEGYEAFLSAAIRSIEVCGELGIKNTVLHAGWKDGIGKDEWQRENLEFLKLLFPTLERLGVNLLIENSTKANMGDRYYVNSGRELRDFIEYVNHPLVHACWDTGHANCEGAQYDEILTLGEHLYAIHYNDNHGNKDEHLMPYLGTLNHDEVISALIDVGYKGYFTLEATNSLITPSSWPFKARKYKKSTRLAEPPTALRRNIEKTMYEVAKYMLTEYGIFEE